MHSRREATREGYFHPHRYVPEKVKVRYFYKIGPPIEWIGGKLAP